eukprot:5156865-Alexandrium_andersonii.AAC.1
MDSTLECQKKTRVPTQRCHFAIDTLGALGTCTIASGVQSLNCVALGKTSELAPEAPERCALRHFLVGSEACPKHAQRSPTTQTTQNVPIPSPSPIGTF